MSEYLSHTRDILYYKNKRIEVMLHHEDEMDQNHFSKDICSVFWYTRPS
jgi:hypothetical protein